MTVHELVLSNADGRNEVTVHQMYERPVIPVSADCVVNEEDVGRWEHLQGLNIPQLREGAKMEMLIGQDCPDILMPLEVRASGENTGQIPYAVRTVFGWIVNWPLAGSRRKSSASVNYVSTATSTLQRQVEEFWKLEGAYLSACNKGMSLEDQRALSIMENSVKLEDDHYTVAIPFSEKAPSLPNNRVVAKKRLAGLGRKLENNAALKDAYSNNIEALLQKGHDQKLTPEDKEPKAAWYLPHHAVLNPARRLESCLTAQRRIKAHP